MQARFALVQGCDECVAPGDKMGTLEHRAGKVIVKRGLEVGRVWVVAPVDWRSWGGIGLEISDTFREGSGNQWM